MAPKKSCAKRKALQSRYELMCAELSARLHMGVVRGYLEFIMSTSITPDNPAVNACACFYDTRGSSSKHATKKAERGA